MAEGRKLAAILAADIVGYSRLAGVDEELVLARLRTLRSDLIDPTLAVHGGRVVNRTGDGVLVEFRSVVDTCSATLCRCSASNSGSKMRARTWSVLMRSPISTYQCSI